MLDVDELHVEDYLKHVSMGPSDVSTKSTFRSHVGGDGASR